MERYESCINRAKSSYELSKATISTTICFVNKTKELNDIRKEQ